MIECLLLLAALLRTAVCDRADLVAENLLLRQQVGALTRPTRKRPRLRARDKLFWLLARLARPDWRRHLLVVRPETVVRWHRRGWRLFWRWRSRARTGRPRVSAEVRQLIATMAGDNSGWGAERIRGELRKLGMVVSKRSIRRYRWRRAPRPPTRTGRTFLTNHRPRIRAADFLAVQTLTLRTLYVLVFVAHDRREIVHINVTSSPTAAWVWRQLIAATPWGQAPRYLLRDRDAVDGRGFVERARRLGISTLLTPIRAPRANAVAERLVGTLRRECLDVIVVNERHLRADPVGLRPVRQRGPAAPDPGAGHPVAAGPPTSRLGPLPPRARWASPRVRARRLTTAEVLPLHSRHRSSGEGRTPPRTGCSYGCSTSSPSIMILTSWPTTNRLSATMSNAIPKSLRRI